MQIKRYRVTKHRLACFLSLLVVDFRFANLAYSEDLADVDPFAFMSQVVHEAVDKDPSIIQFYIKKEGNALYFKLGKAVRVLPYSPLRGAARTLIIKEYFVRRPKNEQKIWSPFIQNLDEAANAEIQRLNEGQLPPDDDPVYVGPEATDAIADIFDKLASLQNLTRAVNDITPTDRALEGVSAISKMQKVKFIVPPNTRIYYLSVFEHFVLEKYKKLDDLTRNDA